MGSSTGRIQPSIFDYNSLDQSHRSIVQQHTSEIRELLRRSAQDVWKIGQRLSDVRSRLKYGQFLTWLKTEFGWSQRTAYNFINVYETFGDRFAKLATVDIATSVLYQLAAPSVPEELRTQVLQAAEKGVPITNKTVRSAIQGAKQPPAQADAATPAPAPNQPPRPEIVTVIPKAVSRIEVAADAPPIAISPGWYRLDSHHWLFCGDTAASAFVQSAPTAKLTIAVTGQDWAHDWLIDQADNVVILPDEEFSLEKLRSLLQLLSNPGDAVIFPWLPLPEMIAVAHRLNRKVYAGDASLERCRSAIAAAGLMVEPLADAASSAG